MVTLGYSITTTYAIATWYCRQRLLLHRHSRALNLKYSRWTPNIGYFVGNPQTFYTKKLTFCWTRLKAAFVRQILEWIVRLRSVREWGLFWLFCILRNDLLDVYIYISIIYTIEQLTERLTGLQYIVEILATCSISHPIHPKHWISDGTKNIDFACSCQYIAHAAA